MCSSLINVYAPWRYRCVLKARQQEVVRVSEDEGREQEGGDAGERERRRRAVGLASTRERLEGFVQLWAPLRDRARDLEGCMT